MNIDWREIMNILKLIVKIILLILEGYDPSRAVSEIAASSGVSFSELWSNLPSKYK